VKAAIKRIWEAKVKKTEKILKIN